MSKNVISPISSPPNSPQTLSPTSRHERKKTHRKQRSRDKVEQKQIKEKESKLEKEENSEKRLRVIRELLESEKSHVHSLAIVVDHYLRPLDDNSILEFSAIRAIFSNLELIRNWNKTFLAGLEAHLECGDTFGDLFMEMIPIMRQLYTEYNENYDHAMVTYEKVKKNRAFAQFLEKVQLETNEQKDLLTYLYLPVQRILSYDSLLTDILKLTPPNHEDYTQLTNSLNTLKDIEFSAALRARQRKNINKVLSIQNNIENEIQLALPHRRFVYEGEVLLINGKSAKERYCYLFNDLFVCCKSNRRKLDFKEPLETIIVEDLPDTDDFRYLFRLTPSANEYIISSLDKHNWLPLLQSCKKELKELKLEKEREEDGLHNEVEESSRESLINKIVKWSKMEESELVLAEVQELARVLEKYKSVSHSSHIS